MIGEDWDFGFGGCVGIFNYLVKCCDFIRRGLGFTVRGGDGGKKGGFTRRGLGFSIYC